MDRILVILNPAARGERGAALRERIERLSPRAVVRTTSAPGDAEALAERGVAQGYGIIVAAGGDGTINEVVNGIADSGVRLGLLPAGTMNVFATELGLPIDFRKCWDAIENGMDREVDLALANDQYFIQLAGVGLDAQVVKETRWHDKKTFGPLSYMFAATVIAGRKAPRLAIHAEGRPALAGSFVLVGNGRFYGGPFPLFRDASLDDGRLDVIVFKSVGHLDLVRYLQGVLFGTHAAMDDVEYFQTPWLRVTSDSDVPVEVDGELLGNVPVEFRVARQRLAVRVPRSRRRNTPATGKQSPV